VVRRDGSYTKHSIVPHDFSKQGMGFDYDQPLTLGSHCEFEITYKGERLHAMGKVLRSEERGPGRYNTAVVFDQVLVKRAEGRE
jgi:hypothetical protein